MADAFFSRVWDVKKDMDIRTLVDGQRRGSAYFFICPECGSSNCATSSEKPFLYNCFSCGESGDSLDLLERSTGKPKYRIALDTAYQRGIITADEYLSHGGNKEYAAVQPVAPKVLPHREEEPAVQSASNEIKNLVYSRMLSMDAFALTPEAEKYILDVRGESNISGHFFCYHKAFDMQKLLQVIKKDKPDFTPADFEGIPGFYVEFDSPQKKSGKWKFVAPQPGNIGLVVRNGKGEIVGLQMRISSKEWTGPRYLWVSSAPKNNPPKAGEPVTGLGIGPGSPCHVVFPKGIGTNRILITEGIFKARRIASKMQALAISLQGVTNSSGVPKSVSDALLNPAYASLRKEGVRDYSFGLMFDADMVAKEQVYKACRQTYQRLREQYPSKEIVFYLWLMHEGKGIDDLIANHPDDWKKHIYKMPGEDFVPIMDNIRQEVQQIEPFRGKRLQSILGNPEWYHAYSKKVYQMFWSRFLG